MQMNAVTHPVLQELPLPSIQPEGWYRKQLEVQADGFTGHLEEIWADVGSTSGWLGGTGENWERGPYYLDGLVPLAYLLRDQQLIHKAQKWMEWMLKSQREDGFFGPPQNVDWWPRIVALKVLVQYYDATRDARVIPFMHKYFRYQLTMLPQMPLQMWAVARAGENIVSVLWLYEQTQEPYLLELADCLAAQSLDWNAFFNEMPYKQPISHYLNWQELHKLIETHGWRELLQPTQLDPQYVRDLFRKYHASHGVNVAMAIKYPALDYWRTGDARYLEVLKTGILGLDRYHGQFNGIYSCDEHLNGRDPAQGTELCTVVEAMYSLQQILLITGDAVWADRLEQIAYNALPATITADFCAHQYDQQVNQVQCNVAPRNWYNNNETSNIFGLEPHFGCCTANLHQGWPKFAKSLFAKKDDETLSALVYAPTTISTTLHGKPVTIQESTSYPFSETLRFTITVAEPLVFSFALRIPAWTKSPMVTLNGTRYPSIPILDGFVTITRIWQNQDVLALTLPMEVRVIEQDSYVGIMRGPLLYALPIAGEWKKIVERGRFSDWEIYPQSAWNYGLVEPAVAQSDVTVDVRDACNAFAGAEPPVVITLPARKVLNWGMVKNSAGPLPTEFQLGDRETIALSPYGWTKLRIAAFPKIAV
jgi:hypothetical protein